MFNSQEQFTKMLNLGTDSDSELDFMNDNKIEFRKRLGSLLSNSRRIAKKTKCLYCGETRSSFCNSHSIPASFLRNIAVDGSLYSNNKLVNLPLQDEDKGINKSGTFQIICNDCDSKIFREYENQNNYIGNPTNKMLAQIAMKNYLKNISKRHIEIALYDEMSELGLPPNVHVAKQEINNLDLQEFTSGFNRAKRISKKEYGNEYSLSYYEQLNYVAPIAFQGSLSLIFDIDGNIINNIYNPSSNYTIKSIHVCVFPLEKTSIVMMFVDSRDKRYRSFLKQINKLSLSDKLSAINFMIFSYAEDIFIHKKLDEKVLSHKGLVEMSRTASDVLSSTPDFDPISVAKESYSFDKMNDLPNLLLEEYKVKY